MSKKGVIFSPVSGTAIPLSTVSDHAFSSGFLGDGAAVIPTSGTIRSVADGVVTSIASTLHAYNIKTDDGLEILVHLGVDTVELKGEGFKSFVSAGQRVKCGDVIAEMDIGLVESKGYKIETPVVITNPEAVLTLEHENGKIKENEILIRYTM